MLQQLDTADSVRREVAPRTAQKHKSELGQFTTASSGARFMAGMFPPSTLQTLPLAGCRRGRGRVVLRLSRPLGDGRLWL